MSVTRPPLTAAELIARAKGELAEGGDYRRVIAHALVAIAEQGEPECLDAADELAGGPGPLMALPNGDKYTIWLDYNTEGWKPHEFDTLAECFKLMQSYGHIGDFRITRQVEYDIVELSHRGGLV